MTDFDFGIKPPDDFYPIQDHILDETILPQFERTVEKYPKRLAIKDEIESLTYQELDNATTNLAHRIVDEAGNDRSPVAFLLNRELMSIIAVIAIVKASRVSIGLHPSNSKEQLTTLLEDSTAKILITSSEFRATVDHLTKGNKALKVITFDQIQVQKINKQPIYEVKPDDPFGIFYTSGSVGKPKGVVIGHLYKAQSIQYQTNGWFFSPSDRVSLVTSVCYLASHPSLFGALLNGGLLCLFDLKKNSAQKALDWIIDEQLTVFRCTPSIFRTIFGLAPMESVFSKLRFITLGGEPITGSDIELFKLHTEKDCILVNNFSATEAGSICHYPIRRDFPSFQGFLPAGFPAPGKEILLLDDNGQHVNHGETGEIVVRSKYLSLGYWRNEELTAQKFLEDPTNPEVKIYSTGDLGRFRQDGILEVLGRKDTQVKIRGYRMQLEEIDMAIRSLPGVRDAATIVHEDPAAGKKLVAYLSLEDNDKFEVNRFREALAVKLPLYMIPSVFVKMAALPRSATGKLSRRSLPAPTRDRPQLTVPFSSPSPGLESEIASIWKEILAVDRIGVDDNFFDLGGDSLMALLMSLQVEEKTSHPFPQKFFKNPSIRNLRTMMENQDQSGGADNDFTISSHQDLVQPQDAEASQLPRLKRLATRKYSTEDVTHLYRFFDRMVGRSIVKKSFIEAQAWMVKWSQNAFIQKIVYRHRRILFSKWLAALNESGNSVQGNFQMNLLNNMYFQLARPFTKKEKNTAVTLSVYKNSTQLFWQSLGEILENATIPQLEEFFPVIGLDYLKDAYQQGRGVVMVSYHGTPHAGGFIPLTRMLGIETIPTVSYLIPMRQSGLDNRRDQISDAAASTLNAEIALYGQKQLQEGGIISYFSDTDDSRGRTYKVSMAGRAYQMKAGLAEMALNTGAAIVPFTRYCLPDGRIQTEFFSPLQPVGRERQDQVEKVIFSYGEFIEQNWRTHPEAVSWSKIKRHLQFPLSDERQSD